jgi:hypothetical protein
MDQTPQTPEIASETCQSCTHRFAAGRTCGSPALRGQQFCYYHHPARKPRTPQSDRRARRARAIARQSFTITLPTTRRELQTSLNEIARRIAANQIDLRRARLLIHALNLTARNLRPF